MMAAPSIPRQARRVRPYVLTIAIAGFGCIVAIEVGNEINSRTG
jgi:hypothetical protein